MTAALAEAPAAALPGGAGTPFMLAEQDLQVPGSGRPDAILLHIETAAVERQVNRGLRLRLPVHAAAVSEMAEPGAWRGPTYGWSAPYMRRAGREVEQDGWDPADSDCGRIVDDAIVVEAKVGDWRRGLRQLASYQWAGRKTALLMPADTAHRVSGAALSLSGAGVMALSDDGIRWLIHPQERPLGLMADLWLAELAARSIEAAGPCGP